jgi:clan AA aspartic protease
MQGTVVGLQARMGLTIRLSKGFSTVVNCVIDTGFEGYLTLPIETIVELNLPCAGRINANLADNSSVSTEVYWATISWCGGDREITVLAMGQRPLIGTSLLENYHLSIDFCDNGDVVIDDIL